MTSGRSWGRYTCPTVFSTIKGKNNSISYTFCTLHSWRSKFLVWNVSIDPQVHFTGQHGQHLSEHGPSDGRCERGDEIQAGLPPGERRRGEKLPRLMLAHFSLHHLLLIKRLSDHPPPSHLENNTDIFFFNQAYMWICGERWRKASACVICVYVCV